MSRNVKELHYKDYWNKATDKREQLQDLRDITAQQLELSMNWVINMLSESIMDLSRSVRDRRRLSLLLPPRMESIFLQWSRMRSFSYADNGLIKTFEGVEIEYTCPTWDIWVYIDNSGNYDDRTNTITAFKINIREL